MIGDLRGSVKKGDLLYEGKAKKIFSTSDPKKLIQEFKDSLTAFNAQKKGSFQGKGEINLKITTCIFKFLKARKIQTHFVENIDHQNMIVEKLKMIPLEVVVRNKAAGSFSNRYGIPEGTPLAKTLVEFYYKKDELNDPLMTDDHVLALKLATDSEMKTLKKQALLINKNLKTFFKAVGIELIDFKLEFGKNSKGKIVLADEISPDSCRLWDIKTQEKLDKDRFRRDLGKVEESYALVCEKILNKWGKTK